MYEDLALRFNSEEHIRCVFHTLVIRMDSLKDKYKGGVRTFVEKHAPICNRKLAVTCAMGGEDLEGVIKDMVECGLIGQEDFACFDAMSEAMGYELMKSGGESPERDVTFVINWLKGYIHKGGVNVYWSGE